MVVLPSDYFRGVKIKVTSYVEWINVPKYPIDQSCKKIWSKLESVQKCDEMFHFSTLCAIVLFQFCSILQGDLFQILGFELALVLNWCIFDPKLIKPKCVRELADLYNFRKFVYIFQLLIYNFSNKLPPLKHILASPTYVGSYMHCF